MDELILVKSNLAKPSKLRRKYCALAGSWPEMSGMCAIIWRKLTMSHVGAREPLNIARRKEIVRVKQTRYSHIVAKTSTLKTLLPLIVRGLSFQSNFSPKEIYFPSSDLINPVASLK